MPCDCEKYRILCYKFSFSFQTTIPYPAEVAESIYQVENIPVKHGDDEDGPYQEMDTAWKLVLAILPALYHRSVFSLMTSCIPEIVTDRRRSSGFSRGASIY